MIARAKRSGCAHRFVWVVARNEFRGHHLRCYSERSRPYAEDLQIFDKRLLLALSADPYFSLTVTPILGTEQFMLCERLLLLDLEGRLKIGADPLEETSA